MYDLVAESPYLAAAATAGLLAWMVYYHKVVVAPPALHVRRGGRFETFLSQTLPILKEQYWPTFWCVESRLQTVLASFVRATIPDIKYRREILKLSDGGEVTLDWLDSPNLGQDPDEYSGPIILFLPGLTGHSQSEYIKSFIKIAHNRLGAHCVVFNFRGRGGHTLVTPRTYCATKCDDLHAVVRHVRATFPKSRVMAVGVSLGGIVLGNYLTQRQEKAREDLAAAFLVSVCYDCFKGTESLEKNGLNLLLNRHLANCLVRSIKEVKHHFDESGLWDLERVFSSKTIREFDASFTTPQFGYSDVAEYYAEATLSGKLDSVRIPVLALNATDDPMQPGDSLPCLEATTTDYVAILATNYGGHIGFMEGLFPTQYHFSDRVFAQFAKAVFDRHQDLDLVGAAHQ